MNLETAPARRPIPLRWLLAASAAWLAASAASAQQLSGLDLMQALQEGGYVIVMRHAQAHAEPPGERQRAPGNIDGEREIDEYGQAQMAALSYAFREFDIPVGQSLTSPAYRAVQSAHYFGFGRRLEVEELAPPQEGGDAEWLRQRVTQAPADGQNTMIVTHGALIGEAFGDAASDIETAETLIFRAGGDEPDLVARLTVEQWSGIAVEHAGDAG